MIGPKRYSAQTVPPTTPDPFGGYRAHKVEGYYVKHITATPNPINTEDGYNKFIEEHTKHYIFDDGFSDWNMDRELEKYEIDITTLKELE